MSKNIKNEIKAFLAEEEGVGVIEIVLILVVLIGLVIVFKKQINDL
ncbi:MAG: Flp1 family type IVb pilin, partial [Candidatus Avilachnospira sp.]